MSYKFFNAIICAMLFLLISFNVNAAVDRKERKRRFRQAMTEEQYRECKIWFRAVKEGWGISKKEKNIIHYKGNRIDIRTLQRHKALEFVNRKHITNYAHPSIQARGTGTE